MRRSIFFIALTLMLFSCAKEHDMTIIEEEPFVPITKIEVKSLMVSIGDDIPFSCEINGEIFSSLGGGTLFIKEILLEKMGNQIIVRSEGYFDEIRYVTPNLGSHMYMEVSLSKIKENSSYCKEIGTLNGAQGGIISEFKMEIDIPPNSFVDENGNDFNGDVIIYGCNVINGAYSSNIRKFPQNMLIENQKIQNLQISGGLNLVFLDNSDNRLFFKEGNTVKLIIEKYTALQESFPDELDLWYFNNNTNLWEEKENLTTVDQAWEGTIDNLGLIIWGVKSESKIMKMKLLTDDGFIVPNKYLTVFTELDMPFSRAASDHLGIVHINIPVNKDFKIIILDLTGPEPTTEIEFSAIDENSELVIAYDDLILNSINYQNYKGRVLDCNIETVLESGILINAYTNRIGTLDYNALFFSDENGNFEFAQTVTGDDLIEVKAFDYGTSQLSEEQFIFNYKEKEIEFGSISLCE